MASRRTLSALGGYGLVALLISTAAARDVFLTLGGGYSPKGNQVSLERNVLYFQRLVDQVGPAGARHDIYFADGNAPQRDVQYSNLPAVPAANRLMAELLGDEDYLDLEYRNHQIPGVRGEASQQNLDKWFEEVGSTLQSGDRLILYVTAHGARSRDKKKPFNTRLYLWDDASLPASDMAALVDRLPSGVAVVAVMVQCYCGGFANLIFQDADQEKGLNDRDCAGFFATVHDRVAAGCTPDIDEENYHEYSSYFWAAMQGRTRSRDHVVRSDYDGDGEVSFAEAHAYVMLTSPTIDIPVKTSGTFLRAYSKLKSPEHPDLLDANTPCGYLLDLATPAEAAVMEGLSRLLELDHDHRADAADRLADDLQDQRKEIGRELSAKRRKRREIQQDVATDLKDRWPELENLLSATTVELLTTRAVEFEEAVRSHAQYDRFSTLGIEIADLETQRFDLERRWVKCRRLQRVLENVALTRNLPMVAPLPLVRRYERIVAAEQSTLQTVRVPAPLPPEVE